MELLQPGETLGGDFEVIRQLGSGGMGAVYLCRQRSTEKIRALKVMHSRFSGDPSFVERFEREARTGSRIQSHHIVEVVAAGVDPGRRMPWLAMEYLQGLTLADAMAQFGPPGPADGALLSDHLWHALCAAHRANIVHRDLKPENLFLAAVHSPGRPFELKVLDFGIAKWLHPSQGNSTLRVLTPGWGAPEQAIPGAPIATQADVWALGLLFFWLCTGSSFWHDPNNTERVHVQIFNLPIPAASTRARELRARTSFNADFDAWFAKCVTREQNDRFRSASEAFVAWKQLTLPWSSHATPWRTSALPFSETELPDVVQALGFDRTSPADLPSRVDEASSRAGSLLDSRATRPGTSVPFEVSPPGSAAPDGLGKPRRSSRLAWWGSVSGLVVSLGGALALIARGARGPESDAKPTAVAEPVVVDSNHAARAGMLTVPSGKFTFGLGGQAGLLPSTVEFEKPFALDRAEVTVGAYRDCVNASRCTPAAFVEAGQELPSALSAQYEQLCNSRHSNRDHHPVNCVSRSQAQQYCAYRGLRMPTEAEWELAARGWDGRLFPWGQRPPKTCELAVVNGVCPRERESPPTRPAEERAPGAAAPFGHIDLAGNLWEWVAGDWQGEALRGTMGEARPGGPLGIVRGGAWDQSAELATTVSRRALPTTQADVNVGFRCAADL